MKVIIFIFGIVSFLFGGEASSYGDQFQCSNVSAVNVSQLFAYRYHHTTKLKNMQTLTHQITEAEIRLNDSIQDSERLDTAMDDMGISETTETACAETIPHECCEIKRINPFAKSGLYTIKDPCSGDRRFSAARLTVYCDMETDGGGWIVIQRRNASMGWVKFNRKWADYVNGFGDMDGEFWLGLENIYELTKGERMVLQLSAWNQSGNPTVKSNYNYFRLYDAIHRYALASLGSVTTSSGYITSFSYTPRSNYHFQTYDNYAGQTNCPHSRQNGWWYYYREVESIRCNNYIIRRISNSDCSENFNLNGLHQPSSLHGTDQNGERLYWKTSSGVYNTFTNSEMKIRPYSCTLR